MLFNVSQLLKSSSGEVRQYLLDDDEERFEELSGRVVGSLRLLRTDRAVLVSAEISVGVRSDCSRCLARFVHPVQFEFQEEFFPVADVESGATLTLPDSSGFVIDARHTLDLGEAVRQYAILNLAMKPLCRDACTGLCASCGANINLGDCGCLEHGGDPRWSMLAELELESNNLVSKS